jgi:hypothetical protein
MPSSTAASASSRVPATTGFGIVKQLKYQEEILFRGRRPRPASPPSADYHLEFTRLIQ